MPVQVVLRDVEHRGRRGSKSVHAVELEARQLQHPDLRQIGRSLGRAASVSSSVGPILPATATSRPPAPAGWSAMSRSSCRWCRCRPARRRRPAGAQFGQRREWSNCLLQRLSWQAPSSYVKQEQHQPDSGRRASGVNSGRPGRSSKGPAMNSTAAARPQQGESAAVLRACRPR